MGDDSSRLQAAWRRKNEQLVENGMRLLDTFDRMVLGTVFLALLAGGSVSGGERYTLLSPDKRIKAEVTVGERLSYCVSFDGKKIVLDSPLSLEFKDGGMPGRDLVVKGQKRKTLKDKWEPVFGQHKQILDYCNELRLELAEAAMPGRGLEVIFRVYDDGVAFRYYLPKQAGIKEFVLTKENSQFRFAKDHTVWAADYKKFVGHQEEEFRKVRLSSIKPESVIGVPLLVKVDESIYVALTEANLTDWAGMYLWGIKSDSSKGVTLTTKLSPRVDGEGLVKASRPRYSPWRVIMIGQRPGDLIESEIILNLNEPCAIKDTSWIKPGMMAWDHWWSGDVKMDTATLKEYIQLAADMGFSYQLIDWTWYGPNPLENPDLDITTVEPDVDMPELLRFAKQRNVRLWLWLHWTHTDKQYKEAFALYEKWGVAGVKIDFMQRDDQEMVNWYHKIVKKAAEHHLLVNFHGAYKPTGFRRTYPNLITREGVLGNEFNKWSKRVTPEHNCTLPFTRMLAGPMDYTPGGFLNRSREKFQTNVKPTQVMGTRCHQLAMFVVYDSPLCCVCDHPRNYKGQAGLDFLRVVPAVWDDTRVINGEVGEYITMARKSGERWFIGAMTDWEARRLEIRLDFLGKDKYTAHIFADAPDSGENAEKLAEEKRTVKADDILTIQMASGGGLAAYLVPKR
ncbi:MAG: glycoside hydrolase family 97 protein [Planctomycetota bacterium]|jgi:alpha-glucosidase